MSNNNNGQWETVTKSKKFKNLEKKVVAHKEKKREEALKPKLDEICTYAICNDTNGVLQNRKLSFVFYKCKVLSELYCKNWTTKLFIVSSQCRS